MISQRQRTAVCEREKGITREREREVEPMRCTWPAPVECHCVRASEIEALHCLAMMQHISHSVLALHLAVPSASSCSC